MSLRLRLFLLFGGLVALLVLAQWWWVRVLTRDLHSELDQVVHSVGSSVVAFFGDPDSEPLHRKMVECPDGEDCDDMQVTRVGVVRLGAESEEGTEHKTVIRKLRWQRQNEDSAETKVLEEEVVLKEEAHASDHYSFAYVQDHTSSAGDADPTKLDTHVKVHIEHHDGESYLWMGGPNVERRFQIPQQGFQNKLERFSGRLVFGSMGFLALGLVLAGAVAHRVTAPLRRLSDAAVQIGDGALGTRVADPGAGEVGQAIEAFNRMSSRLEELDARARSLEANKHLGEIGEIARGLAHTLRNPLNALSLSVDELAAPSAEPSTDKTSPGLAESARRQIRRIDQSIRSFLALASQSGGVLTDVAVGELIEDVALEALQDGRGKARLDLELAEDLPRLCAVEPELRAVLQALVVNAVEASPEGGRVTIRAEAAGDHRLAIEIDDEGPGLAPEVRERLFTPHLSTKANGSGMGLFLAHRITTNRYGGALDLLDREEGGTRVVLELGERVASPQETGDE
ncbi:MAG: HAMP domain-containing histidine kinase [bacterium]|nr:HAMP domain-containing histidine kinase [bacterium]